MVWCNGGLTAYCLVVFVLGWLGTWLVWLLRGLLLLCFLGLVGAALRTYCRWLFVAGLFYGFLWFLVGCLCSSSMLCWVL